MRTTLVVLSVLLAALPAAAEVSGRPTVIAGDMLMVNGLRVQLYGIDAPELDQMCMANSKRYRCGYIAKTALMDLVAGVDVTCRLESDRNADQAVATCEAGGFDLSANMVHTGWALADRKVTAKYTPVEARARKARRGLWRGDFVPPWEWRKR